MAGSFLVAGGGWVRPVPTASARARISLYVHA
jgi:hypothetical protein